MNGGLRVILELDEGAGLIQGRVGLAGGESSRFDGYVQLIGHLEALQGRTPDPPTATPDIDRPPREAPRP
jgi:hypothetical protein